MKTQFNLTRFRSFLRKNTISQFNQFIKKSSFYFLPELCPQKLYDILYATQKVRYM